MARSLTGRMHYIFKNTVRIKYILSRCIIAPLIDTIQFIHRISSRHNGYCSGETWIIENNTVAIALTSSEFSPKDPTVIQLNITVNDNKLQAYNMVFNGLTFHEIPSQDLWLPSSGARNSIYYLYPAIIRQPRSGGRNKR